jgi:hypothetical protein
MVYEPPTLTSKPDPAFDRLAESSELLLSLAGRLRDDGLYIIS